VRFISSERETPRHKAVASSKSASRPWRAPEHLLPELAAPVKGEAPTGNVLQKFVRNKKVEKIVPRLSDETKALGFYNGHIFLRLR
jgi:hypothetical protein